MNEARCGNGRDRHEDKGAQTLDEVNPSTGAIEHAYPVPLDGSEHFPTPDVSANGQWVVMESGQKVVAVQPNVTPDNSVAWTSNSGGAALSLDGIVQARPLIVGSVVVVPTENDSLYGLSLTTGAKQWGPVSLGTPETQAHNDSLPDVRGCGNIWPLGITSNPVLAPNGSVYAVGEVQTGNTPGADPPVFKIMAVNPADGTPAVAPTAIDPASMTTTPVEIWAEQQRAGLVTANNTIYVGFGGLSGDCGTYHGYEVAVSEAGNLVGDLETTANTNAGAIWATAGAAVDSAGTVYVSTGNSTQTPATGTDYSDSVLAITPTLLSGGAHVTAPSDYFQPAEWQSDNNADADLGSAAPVLLPNGTQLFIIGKQHNAFLLTTSSLGGGDHHTPADRLNGACSGESFGQNAALGNAAYFNCSNSGMWQVHIS